MIVVKGIWSPRIFFYGISLRALKWPLENDFEWYYDNEVGFVNIKNSECILLNLSSL
jgi:hypothetical protein